MCADGCDIKYKQRAEKKGVTEERRESDVHRRECLHYPHCLMQHVPTHHCPPPPTARLTHPLTHSLTRYFTHTGPSVTQWGCLILSDEERECV